MYQCMDGYYLESGNYTLVCDESKTWQGEKPVCIGKQNLNIQVKGYIHMHEGLFISPTFGKT